MPNRRHYISAEQYPTPIITQIDRPQYIVEFTPTSPAMSTASDCSTSSTSSIMSKLSERAKKFTQSLKLRRNKRSYQETPWWETFEDEDIWG